MAKTIDIEVQRNSRRFQPNCLVSSDIAPDTLIREAEGLVKSGRIEPAIARYGNIAAKYPCDIRLYNRMGILNCRFGRVAHAVTCFRQAIDIQPNIALIHNNLGNALAEMADIAGAHEAYHQALALKPDYAEAHNNLGNLYQEQGRLAEAVDHYQQALSIRPAYVNALNNLGSALQRQGKLGAAIDTLRKALSLEPNLADAHNNLANALVGAGQIDEALTHAQHALNLAPDRKMFASNVLMNLYYKADATPQVILDYSKRLFSEPGPQKRAFSGRLPCISDKSRLKVGFVSADFRRHSVSFFFLPLLQALDRGRVNVFCYSSVMRPDALTQHIMNLADRWRSITGLSDSRAAELIAADQIDILIDLAGHTSGNRLDVFALRPAPVQVSWLGYPGTTGLDAMDYRLTDAIADPPGNSESHYSEKLLRLPNGFLCYNPIDEAPPVAELPFLSTGCITFGSFNNLPKLNAGVISLWSELLRQVPGSRLLIKARQLADPTICQNVRKQFQSRGAAPERILFVPRVETTGEHLDLYRHIDIALDPFPYNGTTTTCEALWMGVPVITFCGNRHSARVGASILARLGLFDLCAESRDRFLRIGSRLAADTEKLQRLRRSLRFRMQSSMLCDAKAFAGQFVDLLVNILPEGQRQRK